MLMDAPIFTYPARHEEPSRATAKKGAPLKVRIIIDEGPRHPRPSTHQKVEAVDGPQFLWGSVGSKALLAFVHGLPSRLDAEIAITVVWREVCRRKARETASALSQRAIVTLAFQEGFLP